MPSALLLLLAAADVRFVLRGFLVLPSYMLLCGAGRSPDASLAEQRAHLREAHRLYNFVIDSVQAALLEGVFCPGALAKQLRGLSYSTPQPLRCKCASAACSPSHLLIRSHLLSPHTFRIATAL